jgi:hypothetical protein
MHSNTSGNKTQWYLTSSIFSVYIFVVCTQWFFVVIALAISLEAETDVYISDANFSSQYLGLELVRHKKAHSKMWFDANQAVNIDPKQFPGIFLLCVPKKSVSHCITFSYHIQIYAILRAKKSASLTPLQC